MRKLFYVLGLSLAILGANQANATSQENTSRERIVLKESSTTRQTETLESKLAKLTNKEGKRIFTEWSSMWFRIYGGTFEYAKSLATITDTEGNSIFNGWDIAHFKKYGGTIEYAKKFAEITDKRGNPKFSGRVLVEFKEERITVEYAKEFIKLGFPKWEVIKQFKEAGVTTDYAKELKSLGFDYKSIRRFKQLEMEISDIIQFNDTPKPNATIIFPTNDGNDSLGHPISIEFYNKIKKSYDTWVRVASTQQEVYDTINYVPNIELLVLAGHGERFRLALGENEDDEKQTIDISDRELKKYLQKLNPNATIFLHSCSNAKRNIFRRNLANFVIKAAKGRKVIAATKPFDSEEIHVKSIYPFDIKIIDKETGEDITYTNK